MFYDMKNTGIVIIVILTMIATTTVVVAPPLLPESYWGYATLDDVPPPINTSITVEVYGTGEVVGENATLNATGFYSLNVLFDDSDTPGDEGADNGDNLTWKIDGINCSVPAPGTDTAVSGGHNDNFNITASSPAPPPVAVPGCNMIGLLALIGLSVMLAVATLKKKK